MKTIKHNGIALLVTLMFIILITVSLGYALKQVNRSSQLIKNEKLLYQTSFIVEDVLTMLNNSSDIQLIAKENSIDNLAILLAQSTYIPIELADTKLVLKISSARAKLNPNTLTPTTIPIMKQYLNTKMVNSDYADILLDSLSGIKEDNSYNSRIFDENPNLFRDYIASKEHLQNINTFYKKEFNDNALKNINFKELFYFCADKNTSIDLNYATTEVWEMLLATTPQRAQELYDNGFGMYKSLEDLHLNRDELTQLQHFKISFFEPILLIELDITKSAHCAKIFFEYNIAKKRGSNFVYKI